ncbi:hypothetical protein [Leifsonia sp. Leaf264]|uniref:hypothetical protein n=1 Tax=Leifsonia sp. Leaf264 TaxID=1736314 RepID=UPI0012FB5249|nr:hypothetical protein [Leifsonia sp. Leaf264]
MKITARPVAALVAAAVIASSLAGCALLPTGTAPAFEASGATVDTPVGKLPTLATVEPGDDWKPLTVGELRFKVPASWVDLQAGNGADISADLGHEFVLFGPEDRKSPATMWVSASDRESTVEFDYPKDGPIGPASRFTVPVDGAYAVYGQTSAVDTTEDDAAGWAHPDTFQLTVVTDEHTYRIYDVAERSGKSVDTFKAIAGSMELVPTAG